MPAPTALRSEEREKREREHSRQQVTRGVVSTPKAATATQPLFTFHMAFHEKNVSGFGLWGVLGRRSSLANFDK